MSVLRWLFHPLFLLLVLIAVAVYLNRDVLLAENDHAGKVGEMVGKVEALISRMESQPAPETGEDNGTKSVAAGESRAVSGEGIPSLLDVVPPPVDEAAVVEEALPPEGEAATAAQEEGDALTGKSMTAAEPSAMPAPEVPALSEVEVPETDGLPEVPTEITADVHEPVVDSQPEAAVNAVVPERAIIADSPDPQSLEQLWYEARFAAWNGDAARAIGRYREIIALQPGNPDAYGEMGNVMLRLGDREGAAEAYYQAAHRLVKAGNPMMAWQLLDVIAGLSPSRADQLYRELRQR